MWGPWEDDDDDDEACAFLFKYAIILCLSIIIVSSSNFAFDSVLYTVLCYARARTFFGSTFYFGLSVNFTCGMKVKPQIVTIYINEL